MKIVRVIRAVVRWLRGKKTEDEVKEVIEIVKSNIEQDKKSYKQYRPWKV